MIARIQKSLQDKEQGFTLIELLVVVVIIGILAAIAIPTFLNQRAKAWEKAALSDLRNAAVLQEENFSDKGSYTTAKTDLTGLKESDGVTVTANVGTTTRYCLSAVHANLKDGQVFVLDSDVGKAGKVGTKIPGSEKTFQGCGTPSGTGGE